MKYTGKRRIFYLFACIMIATIFYMIYVLNSLTSDDSVVQNKVIEENLKYKIDTLEKKAAENEAILKQLEKFYQSLLDKEKGKLGKTRYNEENEAQINNESNQKSSQKGALNVILNKVISKAVSYETQCPWVNDLKPHNADIEISKLIDELSFDDIDGGVWKQGFDIKYDDKQWTEDDKLHVVIIPHSHNDPGWIMTFEEYFAKRTKNILDTLVEALEGNKTRKFVWAETSYMSLWWNEASEEMRSRMRRLIVETKQLEIVTGGWVMTDEANSHYYAMIEQMIEGHEWLRANIDKSIRPQYGWSIDPFGYTPTMAYLLKQMGFQGMLIQRVHYHLKKYLSKENRLEFMWKQSWSTHESKDTSILCHVMPFYSYDVPHTCGPDPKICCQFDFKRSSGVYSCPWGIQPQPISPANVEERAWTLLDQYRKKSQLYGGENNHNVVLIPLGDDFRWQDMREANDQYLNYEMLINYMNSRKDWNVDVRFGTLSDYFELLKQQSEKKNKPFETLSGDFFTYADRQDHYWSGYFTSRVFYKRLNRLVEYYLRNAEIAFSLSNLAQMDREKKLTVANNLYKQLLVARRNLGLFQHHDGITGTSKTYVVNDYANKLYTALENSKTITENCLSYLLSNGDQNRFDIDDIRLNPESLASRYIPIIRFSQNQPKTVVVLFNSQLNKRTEIVSFRVSSPNVSVLDSNNNKLRSQISLIWPNSDNEPLSGVDSTTSSDDFDYSYDIAGFEKLYYELLFEVDIDALSTKSYTIVQQTEDPTNIEQSEVTFYHVKPVKLEDVFLKTNENQKTNWEKISKFSINSIRESEVKLKVNDKFDAVFSTKTGFLEKFESKSSKEVKSRIKLIKYGTTNSQEKSGAYLFLPDGQATDIDPNLLRWIRVEHGNKLRDRVCVNYTIVLHCVEIYHSQLNDQVLKMPLLNIWNVVDLRQTHNYELSMHIETDIDNTNSIYTDLNGFQYVKRRGFLSKLTIQGNVYPMPTGAFIQDDSMRLSVLTGQPVGVASLEKGSIQFFLDRRLDQDDNRGMEQAMNDNVVVSSRFLLLFESIVQGHPKQNSNELERLSLPSITSQSLSNNLLNPLLKLIVKNAYTNVEFFGNRKFLETQAPCDLHLVNLRTMQNDKEEPVSGQVGLILHRFAYNDCKQTSESIQSAYIDSSSFVKHMCSSSNSFSFVDFFKSHLSPRSMKIANTFLTLTPKDIFTEDDFYHIHSKDNIVKYVQPMQIEAFRIDFG